MKLKKNILKEKKVHVRLKTTKNSFLRTVICKNKFIASQIGKIKLTLKYINLSVCVYTHTHTHTYIYIYIYIYTHTEDKI